MTRESVVEEPVGRTWSETLDSIAAQLELQRQALALGTPAPPDLEIDPPESPIGDPDLALRALALLDESELMADLAVERLVVARSGRARRAMGVRGR